MKKGKGLILTAGILEILFAVGLFSIIALYFLEVGFVGDLLLSFLALCSTILSNAYIINILEILGYIFLGALGLIGLLSLIFGSLCVSKFTKTQKVYYKRGGGLITSCILGTIALAFFVLLYIRLNSLLALIIIGLLSLILLLKYLGTGMFYCGKKEYIKETPVA